MRPPPAVPEIIPQDVMASGLHAHRSAARVGGGQADALDVTILQREQLRCADQELPVLEAFSVKWTDEVFARTSG